MSEEKKQVLREIWKQRMCLKRASLNIEQKEEFCKKDRKEDVTSGLPSILKNKRHGVKDAEKGNTRNGHRILQRRKKHSVKNAEKGSTRNGHHIFQRREKHTVKNFNGIIVTTDPGKQKRKDCLRELSVH